MALGRRLLFGVVGLTLLVAYGSAAALVVAAYASLLVADVSLDVAVAVLVATTLVVAYLHWRHGTARILARLNAVPLSPRDAPTAYRQLETLAARMDVEQPRLYVARLPAPNAFSVGGAEHAVVFDRSLFRVLDPAEFQAILAHELAHVERRDSLLQALAATLARTLVAVLAMALLPVGLLARGVDRFAAWTTGRPGDSDRFTLHERVGAVVVGAFVLATLLVRARSRQQEFAADDRAVEVTGDPLELASALEKIDRAQSAGGLLDRLYGRRRQRSDAEELFSTHPALDDRIERLEKLAGQQSDGYRRIEVS